MWEVDWKSDPLIFLEVGRWVQTIFCVEDTNPRNFLPWQHPPTIVIIPARLWLLWHIIHFLAGFSGRFNFPMPRIFLISTHFFQLLSNLTILSTTYNTISITAYWQRRTCRLDYSFNWNLRSERKCYLDSQSDKLVSAQLMSSQLQREVFSMNARPSHFLSTNGH